MPPAVAATPQQATFVEDVPIQAWVVSSPVSSVIMGALSSTGISVHCSRTVHMPLHSRNRSL